MVERRSFIRHPGLKPDYEVRSFADMQWLMDESYIQIRERDGKSFTFELTGQALDTRSG